MSALTYAVVVRWFWLTYEIGKFPNALIVFETSFTYFERGNQIVIQMLEELSHEKSYCA
jgi:hypothetical protein